MKRFICLLIVITMLACMLIACKDTQSDDGKGNSTGDNTNGANTSADTSAPDPSKNGLGADGLYTTGYTAEQLKQYDGETFTIRSIEDMGVAKWNFDFEEPTSEDAIDNVFYERKMYIEETMGIEFSEILATDYFGNQASYESVQHLVTAGVSDFDVVSGRCNECLFAWGEGAIYTYDQLDYVDLTKGYWAQDVNPDLTIANQQYIAVGAADLSVNEFMFTLLFNKDLLKQKQLDAPYQLVLDGKWTVDKMSEYMRNSWDDVNSSDTMDQGDGFGYLSDSRMILPHFIDSCGSRMVMKDSDDLPYLNFDDEKFYNILVRTFELMNDEKNWFNGYSGGGDVPASNIKMFTNDQAMFMDCSFHYVPQLRNMDADFGIIPYPKWDEAQEDYYARVSYYSALMVPNTCKDPQFSGLVMEVMQCYSQNYLTPAYFDISLKGRDARDEESQAMLDIIFTHRAVDLGDTTFCDSIRDGLVSGMINDKSISISKLTSAEKGLNRTINKYISGAQDAYGF